MKRTFIALGTAAALVAGSVTLPTTANANPAWLLPVLIAGGVVTGGALIVAADANARRGDVYVRPTGTTCQIMRQQTTDGRWQRVRVCQ